MRLALLALAMVAAPALAEPTVTSSLGVIRVLDKITGLVTDLNMESGETTRHGHLTVTMGECRYPVENPAGDAYAQLVIHDARQSEPVFSGWMIASAPALNALDHPRYDVWVLECAIPERPSVPEPVPEEDPVLEIVPAPE